MIRDGGVHGQKGAPGPSRPANAAPIKQRAIVEDISYFQDQRGRLVEPIAAGQIPEQLNSHLIITEPGCIRGNHYHMSGTEIFVMFGPGLVRLREEGVLRDVVVAENACVRFTIPPGVSHAFQNLGSRPMAAISFNTHLHDRTRPDVVPDILIPVNP
jgi:dTDP-4-dehydrorhamnose 3,5-epimerase-like enzyme